MANKVLQAIQSNRYPQWLQDVVLETQEAADSVVHHEAWYHFHDGTISRSRHQALLIGFWPLIERFPQFLALNLLKCSYGTDSTLNGARGWLIKNLRIEQRHAEMYRDWSECAGIPRKTLYESARPATATAITDWCWHVCESGNLPEGMAATNFAIEGVTGEWCQLVGESEDYQNLFDAGERKKALKWIQAHAAYDDTHPVEALDIIHALLGNTPSLESIHRVKSAIQKSYELYRLALDTGMASSSSPEESRKVEVEHVSQN